MPNAGSLVPNDVALRHISQVFHSDVALTPASSPSRAGTPNKARRRSGSMTIR
ncbi:unannotated protein [freshwater metagenome]|uniref:Unannotated protein n=1 Tax=freshwater metagenome TaxID=449393 RepID=A0A6J7KSS8_9ZZZZ